MKFLLALLLFTLPAHAIIIEDSPERLVFEVQWALPLFGDVVYVYGNMTDIVPGETYVRVLGERTSNPLHWFIEAHRYVDGVALPSVVFTVLFRNHWEEPIYGTASAPFISLPADHVFAVAGNDHAARFVVGALPVPDTGSTAGLLLLGLFALGIWCTQLVRFVSASG